MQPLGVTVEMRTARRPDPIESVLTGASAAIRRVREEIRALARTPFRCVLVHGETGTGKDRVARALLAASDRLERRLETLACPTLSHEHAESEILGTCRGAHPGALDRPGLVERAGGGILLLEEVSALPPTLQARLLGLLESREIRRLGGIRSVPVRAAIVASTHQDLADRTRQGLFRDDLYYRLVQDGLIRMPALRERLDDVPALARAFLAELPAPRPLAPSALAALRASDWPGNLRQLRAVVRAAAWLARGGSIDRRCVEQAMARIAPPRRATVAPGPPAPRSFHRATCDLRRTLLIDALEEAGGNQTRAGILLGLHEPRHGGGDPPSLQARKLAHRKFRYWWSRLVETSAAAGPVPGNA